MVLTFWEGDHEQILTVVRAYSYRECYLTISPLLLEDKKEEFVAVVAPDVRAAKNRSLYERISTNLLLF